MRHHHITRPVLILVLSALVGCATVAPSTPAEQVVEAFPKPAPLKNAPSIIRLQVSSVNDELHFVSLDRPSWQGMVLEPHRITMQNDSVLLHTHELEWDLGETKVTLRDGRVALEYRVAYGKTSRIVFEAVGGDVQVSENGKWLKRGPDALVDLSADTGKILQF